MPRSITCSFLRRSRHYVPERLLYMADMRCRQSWWSTWLDAPDTVALSVNQWRTQKFFMGGLIQWHMVGSLCDVTIWHHMFPNQRFGEVCWHNIHVFLHGFPLFCVIALNIIYQRSKLGYWRKINSMLLHRGL